MEERKRSAHRSPARLPENASEGLYELNVDAAFHDQGDAKLDSSLGLEGTTSPSASEDPHDASH